MIEENSTNDQQQTSVAVAVSTGTVDLATATYSQGSKSQVIVAGATASLAPESAAMVHNDPKADQHEILVKKGSGDIERNGETVRLADWEKVNFHDQSAHMEKGKDIGPPTPISPANMMPIFVSQDPKPIEFSWTPMANAKGYRLRISKNPYFSSTIVDRTVKTADVMVSGLGQGAYYWLVLSQDAAGKESVESEKNRFTIIPKGQDTEAITLDIDPFIQHGHVIEMTGKTEVGARVMVNGREVPVVGTDGGFHYFTPPLPAGESAITITAQNAKGGVNTLAEESGDSVKARRRVNRLKGKNFGARHDREISHRIIMIRFPANEGAVQNLVRDLRQQRENSFAYVRQRLSFRFIAHS